MFGYIATITQSCAHVGVCAYRYRFQDLWFGRCTSDLEVYTSYFRKVSQCHLQSSEQISTHPSLLSLNAPPPVLAHLGLSVAVAHGASVPPRQAASQDFGLFVAVVHGTSVHPRQVASRER